jgi:hypothetical protein
MEPIVMGIRLVSGVDRLQRYGSEALFSCIQKDSIYTISDI